MQPAGLAAGDTAPNFVAQTLDGADLKLSDLRGKLVLIDFWATWSAASVSRINALKEVHATFAGGGLAVISMTWPQIWSEGAEQGRLARAFGIYRIPANVLIDADGTVIARDLRDDALFETVGEQIRQMKPARPAGEQAP